MVHDSTPTDEDDAKAAVCVICPCRHVWQQLCGTLCKSTLTFHEEGRLESLCFTSRWDARTCGLPRAVF